MHFRMLKNDLVIQLFWILQFFLLKFLWKKTIVLEVYQYKKTKPIRYEVNDFITDTILIRYTDMELPNMGCSTLC